MDPVRAAPTPMRPNIWAVGVVLGVIVAGCHRQTEPLEALSRDAGPELRKALAVMCTPTNLFDNYGEELQVAYRLHILTAEMRFKPEAGDRPALKALVTNQTASAYSRTCAPYFLLDADSGARSLLTNYVAASDLRYRFNAARAIQWFAWGAKGEAGAWAAVELVKMVENKSLELPYGTYTPTRGHEHHDEDMRDDALTPLPEVIRTLGELRERRAVPALQSIIERRGQVEAAAIALGKIGDPSVAPFLLEKYKNEREHPFGFGRALATLKYQPAVPEMVARLSQATDHYQQEAVLENLLDIGDTSVVPQIERFLESLPPANREMKKVGARILVQIRENDPVDMLLGMLEKEPDKMEKLRLVEALGRYKDGRAINKLLGLAVAADSTTFRRKAIWALARSGNEASLQALVSVMETNSPAPREFDKPAVLEGRPADYSKREAARALQEATRQDIGVDPTGWRRWISENQSNLR